MILNKTALIAIVVIVALVPASCISYERCVAKFGRTSTDTLLAPFEVVVPPDSIITALQIDTLLLMQPGDTVWVESPHSRARIRYWRDKYEMLHIMALCDTIVVRDTIRVAMPVILDPPPPRPPGRLQRLLNTLVALGVIIAVIIVILKFRRK
ncbi:MAG TPA: hypothetical protein VLH56_16945 [Dissulfurispiraceae bacterium]|nr:hypothetical protein [Dissulfurispiraceae bacterium]